MSDFDYSNVFSGKSVSIIFKDVGDVCFEGAETQSVALMGKTAHAHIIDDQTKKMGHMFMVFTGNDDGQSPEPTEKAEKINTLDAVEMDQDLVYEVVGHTDENVRLSDVYKVSQDGPIEVYVDSVALQLLESAEVHRTDERAKELIFDEINETLAMDYS